MMAALVLLLAAAVTWVLRVSFITLLPAARLPARVRRALDDAAPAVMAAIVGTHVAHGEGPAGLLSLPTLAAAITAVIAWRIGNLAASAAGGVVIFGLLQAVM